MKRIGLALLMSGFLIVNSMASDHWAKPQVDDLVARGILKEAVDCDSLVSRELFFSVLVSWVEKVDGAITPVELPFADSEQVSKEYKVTLEKAYGKGILKGVVTGQMRLLDPKGTISRQDSSVGLARAMGVWLESDTGYTDSDQIMPHAVGGVGALTGLGILNGRDDGSLMPRTPITVGELAALMSKVDGHYNKEQLQVLAGTGNGNFADGAGAKSLFMGPEGVFAKGDTLYVFDTYNSLIRKEKGGTVTTVSGIITVRDPYGNAQVGYLDGAEKKALLGRPTDGVMDAKGDLVFTDYANHAVRTLRDGRVYTLAGNGKAGYADGQGGNAQLNGPTGIALGADGMIYVADTLNHCIRRVELSGKMTTVAGTPGESGFSDGTEALFCEPWGLAVGGDGTLYVADSGNQRIRAIKNGVTTTLCGGGDQRDEYGYVLGGYVDGMEAKLNFPRGLTIAGDTLLVADSGNNAIRGITTTGKTITVAGGALHPEQLTTPCDVAYADGLVYIADTLHNQIKTIRFK